MARALAEAEQEEAGGAGAASAAASVGAAAAEEEEGEAFVEGEEETGDWKDKARLVFHPPPLPPVQSAHVLSIPPY